MHDINSLIEIQREIQHKPKPGTIGELISLAPDLRKEYPPVRLSDQPVAGRFMTNWGPQIGAWVIVIFVACFVAGMLVLIEHERDQRRERIAEQRKEMIQTGKLIRKRDYARCMVVVNDAELCKPTGTAYVPPKYSP